MQGLVFIVELASEYRIGVSSVTFLENPFLTFDDYNVLATMQANGDNDYVNANYIDGYERPKQYIASQAPTPDGFVAHWQMIWDNNVHVIVMVTTEVEGGKMKAHRYWPSQDTKQLSFGE